MEKIRLNIESLSDIEQHYGVIGELQGSAGGTSDIYEIQDKYDTYIMKLPYSETIDLLVNEINILSKIHNLSDLFTKYYGVYKYDNKPAMVIEYFEGMILSKLKVPLAEKKVRYILYNIFSALKILYDNGYSHSDIGTHNIMIDEKLKHIKILDISHYDNEIPDKWEEAQWMHEIIITNKEIWRKLYKSITPLQYKMGRDVYDAGSVGLFLLDYKDPNDEFYANSEWYKVTLRDKNLQYVIDRCIDIDPSKRPNIDQALELLS